MTTYSIPVTTMSSNAPVLVCAVCQKRVTYVTTQAGGWRCLDCLPLEGSS